MFARHKLRISYNERKQPDKFAALRLQTYR